MLGTVYAEHASLVSRPVALIESLRIWRHLRPPPSVRLVEERRDTEPSSATGRAREAVCRRMRARTAIRRLRGTAARGPRARLAARPAAPGRGAWPARRPRAKA